MYTYMYIYIYTYMYIYIYIYIYHVQNNGNLSDNSEYTEKGHQIPNPSILRANTLVESSEVRVSEGVGRGP
jgi:hypothetical protein